MATLTSPTSPPPTPPEPVEIHTLADLIERLGDVPLHRVRFRPPVGTATEADLIAANARKEGICELVECVLVEKAIGFRESVLTTALIGSLLAFIDPRNLGLLSGPDGTMRLFPGLVRAPDVAFASWDRIPGRCVPREPIPDLVPDLAIEVLRVSNTPGELARKRRDYFEAGVRLVWIIDPKTRTVAAYTDLDDVTQLDANRMLSGGDALPGFELPLTDLFAELDRRG